MDIKWKLTLSNGGNAIFNLKPYHSFQCQGAPDLSSIFIECRFKIIQQSLATIEIAFTSQIALVMVIEYLRFYWNVAAALILQTPFFFLWCNAPLLQIDIIRASSGTANRIKYRNETTFHHGGTTESNSPRASDSWFCQTTKPLRWGAQTHKKWIKKNGTRTRNTAEYANNNGKGGKSLVEESRKRERPRMIRPNYRNYLRGRYETTAKLSTFLLGIL